MSFDVHDLDTFVLVGSAVTLLAILAVRVSSRAGLPSLLIYLLMGVVLGESGVGILSTTRRSPTRSASPRSRSSWPRAVSPPRGARSDPRWGSGSRWRPSGVAVSIAVVAVGAHYLLGLPWELAVLLGAVTSPTDAAAVFSVLRVVPLPRRIGGALEAESGLNDAPTVVLVTLVSSGAWADHGLLGATGIVAWELVDRRASRGWSSGSAGRG